MAEVETPQELDLELVRRVQRGESARELWERALAPMGLDTGFSAPLRRWAQMEVRRQTGYLPYL